MRFQRNDRVIYMGEHRGTVLGEEDFDGYLYNRPSDSWELVMFDDGHRFWVNPQFMSLES